MAKKRTPIDLEDISDLIAGVRSTTEWQKVGLAGQAKILTCERLLQELHAKDPDAITDELLSRLEITAERARELIED